MYDEQIHPKPFFPTSTASEANSITPRKTHTEPTIFRSSQSYVCAPSRQYSFNDLQNSSVLLLLVVVVVVVVVIVAAVYKS